MTDTDNTAAIDAIQALFIQRLIGAKS